jgi:5-methylcytosine-specific restriction endonuclease McrA
MNDPRRYFTPKQSRQKVIACGGKCEQCSLSLYDGFHMHHRVPHSLGGQTILANALALCPPCHRRLHSETKGMANGMP